MNYSQAVADHPAIRSAHERDPELARLLWQASRGEGDHPLDSYSEAAYDLAPREHARALGTGGGFANAFAVKCLMDVARSAQESTSAHEVREVARLAWERFNKRAEQAANIEYGLGFDQSDAWEATREFEREVVGSKIADIAKLAGRMFANLQSARKTQVVQAPEEVYSVELGNDVARLLPSELAHLGEDTEILLLDRLAGRKALQYAVRAYQERERGPLVIALDESGSMHGKRGAYAKAAAIAMIRLAWTDGRTCVVVHWSLGVSQTRCEPGDNHALMTVLKHWLGGGNDAAGALRASAREVVRLASEGKRGGDVVLVTDGVEDMTDAHDKAIDQVLSEGARLWTVGIECHIAEDACIRSRAERFVSIGGDAMAQGDLGGMEGAVL